MVVKVFKFIGWFFQIIFISLSIVVLIKLAEDVYDQFSTNEKSPLNARTFRENVY